MTPKQVRLVRETFASIRGEVDYFAEVFYIQLFEQRPEIQYMFRGDQKQQERKLGAMLTSMIDGLDRLENIKPALWNLGRRHLAYGVRAGDYKIFGEVLMWTIEKFLDEAFTDEVAEAWIAFYEYVSGIMEGRIDFHVDAGEGYDTATA